MDRRLRSRVPPDGDGDGRLGAERVHPVRGGRVRDVRTRLYNAHFVVVRYVNVAPFSPRRQFIGGEDGFTVLLYVLPPLLLFGAGLAVGRYRGIPDATEGPVTGALVLPGYLVCSVAGVFPFEVTVGNASGAPDLLPAIVLTGLLYPAVFGGVGGAVAAATTDERSVLS